MHSSNRNMQVLLLVLVFSCIAAGAMPSSTPAYPPQDSTINNSSALSSYDTTVVNINLRNNYTEHAWAATFYPRMDEFSSLEIAYSAVDYFMFNPNLTIWFEFRGLESAIKTVYSGPLECFVTYFTIVITLHNGEQQSVDWDDGCSDCSQSTCVDGFCGVKRSDLPCDQIDCNIKIYLAWSGSDINQRNLTSVDSRPAVFQNFSATPLTNFGTGLWDDAIYKIEQNAPPPNEY